MPGSGTAVVLMHAERGNVVAGVHLSERRSKFSTSATASTSVNATVGTQLPASAASALAASGGGWAAGSVPGGLGAAIQAAVAAGTNYTVTNQTITVAPPATTSTGAGIVGTTANASIVSETTSAAYTTRTTTTKQVATTSAANTTTIPTTSSTTTSSTSTTTTTGTTTSTSTTSTTTEPLYPMPEQVRLGAMVQDFVLYPGRSCGVPIDADDSIVNATTVMFALGRDEVESEIMHLDKCAEWCHRRPGCDGFVFEEKASRCTLRQADPNDDSLLKSCTNMEGFRTYARMPGIMVLS
ncbi:unnamed protein product [Amoebophrya sp. A25]|nr:unnamed protein product [Amoebophrya sp. A25]|eukprot:GSA25T00002165001.1